jgi:hypothetical protein
VAGSREAVALRHGIIGIHPLAVNAYIQIAHNKALQNNPLTVRLAWPTMRSLALRADGWAVVFGAHG